MGTIWLEFCATFEVYMVLNKIFTWRLSQYMLGIVSAIQQTHKLNKHNQFLVAHGENIHSWG